MATADQNAATNTNLAYKAMLDYKTTVANDPVNKALWAKAIALMSSCAKSFS